MTDILKQTLDAYFSNLKEYQLIILLLFTCAISAVQITQAIYVSNKIEKFKTVLKKSEIKFSRYNELQVDALREIYHKLVIFHGSNSNLFYSKYQKNDHAQYKKRIIEWMNSYWECINQFSLEKILLSEKIKEQVSRTIKDFNEVRDIISKEKESLEDVEMEGQGNWNIMYDYSDNELEIINKRIERLKSNDFIINSEKHIKELRLSIEKHFALMNA